MSAVTANHSAAFGTGSTTGVDAVRGAGRSYMSSLPRDRASHPSRARMTGEDLTRMPPGGGLLTVARPCRTHTGFHAQSRRSLTLATSHPPRQQPAPHAAGTTAGCQRRTLFLQGAL